MLQPRLEGRHFQVVAIDHHGSKACYLHPRMTEITDAVRLAEHGHYQGVGLESVQATKQT